VLPAERLHIVFVLGYPTRTRGGTEHAALAFSRGLARRGHRITAVFRREGELLPEYRQFCERVFVLTSAGAALRFAAALVTPGRAPRGAIVYGHHAGRSFELWALGVATRSRVVCHLHLPAPERLGRLTGFGLRRLDRFLAVSRATGDDWARRHAIRPSRITVVPNGVDVDRFVPAGDAAVAKTEYGLDPAEPVISFLGRLDRAKGPDLLIRGFAAFRAQHPGRRAALLIGGAPLWEGHGYLAELRQLAAESGAGPDIRFIGQVSDTRRFYQASDLFVLPSVWPDPQPLTLTESMACGVPALASRIGGIPEILGPDFPEHLFEPGRVDEIAARLGRFAEWRTHDPALGARCRRVAEQKFSLEACIDRVEAALGHCAAGGPG